MHFVINANYFSGILNRNNKPILINGNSLLANTIDSSNNIVKNTNNSAITTEMLNGIKSTYVYTDIIPLEAQYKTLIDGQVVVDGSPLFLYKGRVLELEGAFAYTHMTCADGISKNGGIINGNVTNYFPDNTQTIYVSTADATYNIFDQSGDNEFIAFTNNKIALVNTSQGWKTFSKLKHNVFPINRYSLSTREMYGRTDGIVYGFIQLSANDIKKMQGCIAFEPTDLSIYEFRN